LRSHAFEKLTVLRDHPAFVQMREHKKPKERPMCASLNKLHYICLHTFKTIMIIFPFSFLTLLNAVKSFDKEVVAMHWVGEVDYLRWMVHYKVK
jgi:hypothetical protein